MDTQVEGGKKFYKRWWFWAIVAIVLIVLSSIGSGRNSPSESVPAPTETGSTVASSSVSQAQASVTPQVLLNISGSGTKTTEKFTAASDWDLNWSYDCSNFSSQGNFAVMIYNGDGSMSFNNAAVNQLGESGTDVEHYHSGGTFYLVVNSECSWKIQAKG